jgi:hypothetical protein
MVSENETGEYKRAELVNGFTELLQVVTNLAIAKTKVKNCHDFSLHGIVYTFTRWKRLFKKVQHSVLMTMRIKLGCPM